MRDLPALWRSAEWRAEAEHWIRQRVQEAGREVVGPIEQFRVRFWSTLLTVPTDQGLLWFKENAPSQSFEAGLVALLARLAPGRVPPVLAVEGDLGWSLTEDLGPPLAQDPALADPAVAMAARADVAHRYAVLQRSLEPRLRPMFDARVPAFEDGNALAYAVALADDLARLPEGDGRRLDADQRRHVDEGLHRLGDAAAILEASGIKDSLEHNDLHLSNAVRRPSGEVAFIDFGDAVWSHPFASIRVMLWQSRLAGFAPGDDAYERLIDAYLDPWSEVAPAGELRRALVAAERIGCLHRAESWRRLMGDVPLVVVPEDLRSVIGFWLRAAVAADPYDATRE